MCQNLSISSTEFELSDSGMDSRSLFGLENILKDSVQYSREHEMEAEEVIFQECLSSIEQLRYKLDKLNSPKKTESFSTGISTLSNSEKLPSSFGAFVLVGT